jgi:hypothetical protein
VTKTKTEVLLPAGSWRQMQIFTPQLFCVLLLLNFCCHTPRNLTSSLSHFPEPTTHSGLSFRPVCAKEKSRLPHYTNTVTRALDANLKRPIWRNFNKLVHVYTQESRLVQSRQEIITCFADVSISCRGGGRCKK